MGLETPLPPEGGPAPAASAAAAENRAVSLPPEPEAIATSSFNLPDFAEKADGLDAIKKAIDDAASVGGGLWVSYLFVLFYLAVAAGAVTHKDLFFENPVKLPFLGIELPLLAFFFLAPILFVIVHAYTLVHLAMLGDKARRFHQVLNDQISDNRALPKKIQQRNAALRAGLRRQLPSNIFVQFLAGPRDVRESFFGWFLYGIAWITLAVSPVFLLLLIQIQFLPFHSLFVTWAQRIALGVDLALLSWLWRKIMTGRWIYDRRSRWYWLGVGSDAMIGVAAILFSWMVVTFPGEWQENHRPEWRFLPATDEWGDPATQKDAMGRPRRAFWDWILNADRVSLHEWLFNEDADRITRRRIPFSSTLVLPGLNIYEALGADDPDKLKGRDFLFRARGRDLRGAIFDFANLSKVDFEGADLRGASFKDARLQGASLISVQLRDASLDLAQLQGAPLDGAQMQSASLVGAQLRGASLENAQLQGASLNGAQLQGASLKDTQLEGASLGGAQLQSALLRGALLQTALLDNAQLQGASVDQAQLQGASLVSADLQGASLVSTDLQGAWLDGAQLQGASLDSAQLQGAWLDGAQLQGASLDSAQLQGASLELAVLETTDLSGAFLWRTNRPTSVRKASALRVSGGEVWEPKWRRYGNVQPWDYKAYQALRTRMESFPSGIPRDRAMYFIRTLECPSSDKTLASCDPNVTLPPQATAWRSALEAAGVDERAYAEALANALRGLVCSGGADAIYVVRGEGFQERLHDAGRAASGLIDDLTNKDSKDCPVTAALTDADRAKLLEINQKIEAARGPQKSATSDAPHSP